MKTHHICFRSLDFQGTLCSYLLSIQNVGLKIKYQLTLRMFCGDKSNIIIDNGYKYDAETGILIGQHLEPDKYNIHSAPLFVYNRTDRFYVLCLQYIPGPHKELNACVKMFQALEDVWITRKRRYAPRKYFLSQKLLCKMICSHLGIRCTIIRAIQDKKRLAAQLVIYADLLCNIKCRHEYILDAKPSNTNFVLLQNCRSQADKLPHTQSETRDQKMTYKLPWPSSSV